MCTLLYVKFKFLSCPVHTLCFKVSFIFLFYDLLVMISTNVPGNAGELKVCVNYRGLQFSVITPSFLGLATPLQSVT